MNLPTFDINWNKALSTIATFASGLAAYLIQDENLRALVATFITALLGVISVKAQTMDPQGVPLTEKTKKGETVYESTTPKPNDGTKTN